MNTDCTIKVGDLVKIKEGLKDCCTYGDLIYYDSMHFSGYRKVQYSSENRIMLNDGYIYTTEMLEPFPFKVGDKVILKSGLLTAEMVDGVCYIDAMNFSGIAKVAYIDLRGDIYIEQNLCRKNYNYSAGMLLHAEEVYPDETPRKKPHTVAKPEKNPTKESTDSNLKLIVKSRKIQFNFKN